MSQHKKMSVKIIEERDDFEITILSLEAGGEIFPHYHPNNETEIILSGQLICNGNLVESGTINNWEANTIHGYKNESNQKAEILCLFYGRWTEEKEVLVNQKYF